MSSWRYSSLRERLVSNVVEEAHADLQGPCWLGQEKPCRSGYCRFAVRIPGLGRTYPTRLSAHVALWILDQNPELRSADELFLTYWEFRCSKLELDHRCERPACRNPDHLQAVDHRVNIQLKHDRSPAREPAEADGLPLPF